MYVFLELDSRQDAGIIAGYGVRSYPNFAVLDGQGEVKIPPGRALAEIVRGRPPAEAAGILMSFHFRSWNEAGELPPSADVVIAQLDLLKAYGEADSASALLEKALSEAALAAAERDALKVYRGLAMRRDGSLEEGLALVAEAAPGLDLKEASAEEAQGLAHAVAPFIIARGETVYGVVSSDADARLLGNTLAWLADLEGDIPAPGGLEAEDAVRGMVALAAVLNRPAEAVPWMEAYRATAREGEQQVGAELLAEGIILAAQEQHAQAARRLHVLVQYGSHHPFAPLAGVLSVEAAQAAGDDATAQRNRQAILETWGERLPAHLKARLEQE